MHQQRSSLWWQLGAVHMWEEILTPAAAFAMHAAGARYAGNFQSNLRLFQTYEVLSSRNLDCLTSVCKQLVLFLLVRFSQARSNTSACVPCVKTALRNS